MLGKNSKYLHIYLHTYFLFLSFPFYILPGLNIIHISIQKSNIQKIFQDRYVIIKRTGNIFQSPSIVVQLIHLISKYANNNNINFVFYFYN